MRPSMIVAVVLSAAAAAPAAAQDFPKLKSGLWEMTNSAMKQDGKAARTTLCIDNSLQQDMVKMSTGMMAGMCSKSELKASGNRFLGEAVCKIGGSTMKSKSVMTLNGDTSYRTEAHATFDPPLGNQAVTDTVVEGRYLSACKPGQQPGDMTMPTGQTINIRNMLTGKK